MPLFVPPLIDPDWDDFRFAAEMTDRQFQSIDLRLAKGDVLAEVAGIPRVAKPKLSGSCERQLVKQWLRNGWNTEHILALSSGILEGASGAALQWTFPQAYYAAFAGTLAFFQVAGFTETSHSGVQRKFADLVVKGHYPQSMSFAATGTKRNMVYHGLSLTESDSPAIHFNPNDSDSWDLQIARFLSSTRKLALDAKKDDLKLRTNTGKARSSFREEHWRQAADKLGGTSLLCLLYRKRIKSNYRDIDTFTTSGIDPKRIFEALARIVARLSFVHESIIAASCGAQWYQQAADEYLMDCPGAPLARRVQHVVRLASGAGAV